MTDTKKKIGKVILSVIRVLIVSYAGLMGFVYFFQSHYVYRPEKEIINRPDELGMAYEAVFFKAADGINLTGWFIPADKSQLVILFCHSNAGNISYYLDSMRLYHDLVFSALVFDYRGFGQSGGKPTESGTYLDAEAAWKFIAENKKIPPEDIVIIGRSLGGAIGAWLAERHNPRALILESAFTSFKEMAAEFFPYLPAKALARYDYDTIEYIRGVKCPLLVVHSRDDEVAPFRMGVELFEAANKPKEFLEISGSHNECYESSAKRYTVGLKDFLSKYAPK